jgi:hypothetical protein
MKANAAMITLLKSVDLKTHLTPALMQISQKGFDFRDECYVLRALVAKSPNTSRSRFSDCTGYECFVNSLHIEDYDAKTPLAQAILFLKDIFVIWRTTMPAEVLVGIVSADEFSVVVKVHLRRPEEAWLSSNLDAYEDAIMSFESSDDVFSEIAGNLTAS